MQASLPSPAGRIRRRVALRRLRFGLLAHDQPGVDASTSIFDSRVIRVPPRQIARHVLSSLTFGVGMRNESIAS